MKKIIFLLLPILLLAACDAVQYRTDENFSYLTITLDAEDSSNIIEGILTNGNPPLMRTASAELRNGEIYVTGDVNDGNGGTFPGSLVLRLWMDQGAFQAAISQLSFGGFTADQNLIDRVNMDIANGIAASASNDPNGSIISEIAVTINGLRLTIRTPLEQAS